MADTGKDVCPTTDFRRLLLATEDSEFNTGAVNEAISLAKVCSGKLYVTTVVETNEEYEGDMPSFI